MYRYFSTPMEIIRYSQENKYLPRKEIVVFCLKVSFNELLSRLREFKAQRDPPPEAPSEAA